MNRHMNHHMNCELSDLYISLTLAHSLVYEQKEMYPGCESVRNGGDAPAPPTQESTAEMLKAYAQHLPEIARVTSGIVRPTEQAIVDSSRVTSPQIAQIQTDLYRQFGPALNQIGNDIARQNALAAAATDRDVIAGPGTQLVNQAMALQRQVDPEFFASRQALNQSLGNLLGSIDTSGRLSGGETEAISRSLARDNASRGLNRTPTALSTIENAMMFGGAARDRQLQNQQMMMGALGTGIGLLPAMRTGIDPFQVATGKTSFPNTGENKFTGYQQQGQNAFQMGQDFLGNLTALKQSEMDINSRRRDALDRFTDVMGSLPNIS